MILSFDTIKDKGICCWRQALLRFPFTSDQNGFTILERGLKGLFGLARI